MRNEIIFIICYFLLIFACCYIDFHIFLIYLYRKCFHLNKEKCYRMIEDIDYCMKRRGVFYYMSEGTALGLYRNGDLIEYDDDVDIGIFDKDFKKFKERVVPEMVKLGYVYNNLGFVGKQHVMDVELVKVGSKCCSKYWRLCDELIPHLKTFRKVKWRGMDLSLPEESYYEYLYGKDWKIPQRKKPEH